LTHKLYTRNGITPISAVDATTGRATIQLTSATQTEFGFTTVGYEDIMFLVEYWDTCFDMAPRYYQSVKVRIYN